MLDYIPISLGALVINKASINVDGAVFSYNDHFIDSYLRIFNLSRSAINKNLAFHELAATTNKKYHDTMVWAYIDMESMTAISVFPLNIRPVAATLMGEFLKQYDCIDVAASQIFTEFTVFGTNSFLAWHDESVTPGLRVTIPHAGSPNIRLNIALRRDIDQTYSIIRSAAISSKRSLKNVSTKTALDELHKDIEYTLNGPQYVIIENWLFKRLQVAQQVLASFQEVLQAADKLRDANISINRLMLEDILNGYEISSPSERSYQWRKTASTPLTRLALYNILTEAALTANRSRFKLRHAAGDIMAQSGDLEMQQPDVEWECIVQW